MTEDHEVEPYDLVTALAEVVSPLLRHAGSVFASHQVPFSQAGLLTQLHDQRTPQRMSALAKESGVTPRTVTTLVDGLERRGLVRRDPDPEDRRAVLVSVTGKGDDLMREIEWGRHALADDLIRGLRPEERAQFARLLGRLRRERENGTGASS